MNIFHGLKAKYHHRTERKYIKSIKRKQLNFNCSEKLIMGVSFIAASLEVPLYCVLEHSLQLASYHIVQAMQEPAKREKIVEHLVKVHLQGNELKDDEDVLNLG